MKHLMFAFLCVALTVPGLAQNANDPASRNDVILLLRTMHSHDLLQKMMTVQSQTMRQLIREQVMKDKGSLPANFDEQMKSSIDGLLKGMPMDEILQAMIPAYQRHFTHGDIDAMNTFYSSPAGQKVLEELPAVMQEGTQSAMPIVSQYLSDWEEKTKHQFEPGQKNSPTKPNGGSASQN